MDYKVNLGRAEPFDFAGPAMQLLAKVGYGYQIIAVKDSAGMTGHGLSHRLGEAGVRVSPAMDYRDGVIYIAVARSDYYKALRLLGSWGCWAE